MPLGGGSGTHANVEIFLGMNVEKLRAGVKKGLATTKDMFDKLEAQRNRLRNTSLKMGIALGAELALVHKVTEAAGVQEKAEKQLEVAVMGHKGATLDMVEALKEQASALQQTTEFGDEAIIAAQAYMAEMGVAPHKLGDATEAALDMAAALNMDLTSAARNIGKTMGGFAGELGEVIPELKALTKEELQAGKGIDLLAEKFAGRAAANADTFAGKQQQLKNILGDVEESIGRALIPTLETLFKMIAPVALRVGEFVEHNQRLVGILLGIGIGGTGVIFGLSSLGYMLAGLPALFTAVSGGTGILVMGVIALAGAIAYLTMRQEKVPETMEELDEAIAKSNKSLGMLEHRLKGVSDSHSKVTEGVGDEANKRAKLNNKIAEEQEWLDKLQAAKQRLIDQEGMEEKAKAQAAAMEKLAADAAAASEEMERQRALMELYGTDDPLLASIMARVAAREAEGREMDSAVERWEAMYAPLSDVEAKTYDIVKGIEEMPELINPAVAQMDNLFRDLGGTMVTTFSQSFATIYKTEKRFMVAFGAAFVAMMIGLVRKLVIEKIAELTAVALAEKAKAAIMSPLSFGASLLAVAPIMAALAAGSAALNAIEGALMKKMGAGGGSYQFGGPVPRDMTAKVHKDEIVYNPEYNTLPQFFEWLKMVAPGAAMPMAAGAGGVGDVNIYSNYYGPLMADVDFAKVSARQADELRQALLGM